MGGQRASSRRHSRRGLACANGWQHSAITLCSQAFSDGSRKRHEILRGEGLQRAQENDRDSSVEEERPTRRARKQSASERRTADSRSEETQSAQTTAEVYQPAAPADSPIAAAPTSSEVKARSATNVLDALAASLIAEGGFHFVASQAAINSQPNGRKVESMTLSDNLGGRPLLKLAGGDRSGASDGVTAGFVIRVPDAFERDASEHTVRVRVLARSTDAAPTRLAVAYSTNEVGNSGWRWRDVGPSWDVCEITYDVPKMKNGNGDYIGLMPAESGAPGVEIHSVSATVV